MTTATRNEHTRSLGVRGCSAASRWARGVAIYYDLDVVTAKRPNLSLLSEANGSATNLGGHQARLVGPTPCESFTPRSHRGIRAESGWFSAHWRQAIKGRPRRVVRRGAAHRGVPPPKLLGYPG